MKTGIEILEKVYRIEPLIPDAGIVILLFPVGRYILVEPVGTLHIVVLDISCDPCLELPYRTVFMPVDLLPFQIRKERFCDSIVDWLAWR